MNRIFKAIIIDDEPAATKHLGNLLKKINEVQIIQTFNRPVEGFEAIKLQKPDLLFLDLEMPKLDGIEILRLIETFKIHVHVIIITAYKNRILEAAKYSMIDYLLKPFDPEKLQQSIEKFKLHFEHHGRISQISEFLFQMDRRIRIPKSFEELFFSPQEILYLEADGNYTKIFTRDGKTITSSFHLGKIQKLLPPALFFRISRKTVINQEHLQKIDKRKKICLLKFIDKEISYSKKEAMKSGLLLNGSPLKRTAKN